MAMLTAKVNDRRQLIAQAFAERGGGLQEDVVAFKSSVDDLSLHRPLHN
jgi:hypothetical protein